ncbi:hypothetical protein CEXT_448401 [Caerostris extrusa]|uniref:Uncharacterized protein n=1 Tax=Caerostris extrusa TaxID=172846 RepID=A0AAV4SKK4_CAEEX|nr:hypothetical protein CEXT_448401 [Caerostris extrusa]
MSSLFDMKLIEHEGVTLGLEKLKKPADNRSKETSYWNNKADDKQEQKVAKWPFLKKKTSNYDYNLAYTKIPNNCYWKIDPL